MSKAIGKPVHPFPVIPYQIIVAKRLAQCLNPALPRYLQKSPIYLLLLLKFAHFFIFLHLLIVLFMWIPFSPFFLPLRSGVHLEALETAEIIFARIGVGCMPFKISVALTFHIYFCLNIPVLFLMLIAHLFFYSM